MDTRVLETQQWLNQTYGNNPKFVQLVEDGITGNGTVKGLIRGLQIELGESNIDGVIGDGTVSLFESMFPSGLHENTNEPNSNIVYIIQGGFYCRGIDPNGFDGFFDSGITNAVKKLQGQAGLENQDGVITSIILKAILTTDGYTLSSSGDVKIREIQQGLNKKYYQQIGLIPTNGIYDRKTSRALIKALQKEINVTPDGIWGPGTLNACPTLQRGSTRKNLVYILQYALYANGFDPNGFDGGFGNGVVNAVKKFQGFVKLEDDGIVGKQTWASLLVSYGDKDRKTNACDTRFEITAQRAKILKNNGYTIVGRYLTGGDFKELRDGELERILDEGLSMFPIYQESGNSAESFTEIIGQQQAELAIKAAAKKGIPRNSVIYFAVDYDASESDISKKIVPYFRGINYIFDTLLENPLQYQVGVYGPRQVCTEVSKAYAVSSFVSDMSSGFAGNIGHKLPENWNFDQINNITISDSQYGSLEIDKDVYSGKINVVTSCEENAYTVLQISKVYALALKYRQSNNVKEANRLVLDFLRGSGTYRKPHFNLIAGVPDDTFINLVKQNYPEIVPEEMRLVCGNEDTPMEITHMAVTIEAYIVNFVGEIEDVHYYAGWAGDLCQLGAKCQEIYEKNGRQFTETDISMLVGACKSIAKTFGFSSDKACGFDWEDFQEDIDGDIIGKEVDSVPLPEIFQKYYLDKMYKKRATLFYNGINKANCTATTPKGILSQIARRYTCNPPIYAEVFGFAFGGFDERIFEDVLANGFASKIVGTMNMENS